LRPVYVSFQHTHSMGFAKAEDGTMLPSLIVDQGPRSLMPVLLDITQDYHKKLFLNASWTSESLMPIPSTCMIKAVKQRLTLCKVGIEWPHR
jgi:hypothetical protein